MIPADSSDPANQSTVLESQKTASNEGGTANRTAPPQSPIPSSAPNAAQRNVPAPAIASAPAGDVWNERIWDPEVRIDGDVAQVWAYYTFHRNGAFSHCGVDAFMLLKVGGEWKITQLADSRRTTGCSHTS